MLGVRKLYKLGLSLALATTLSLSPSFGDQKPNPVPESKETITIESFLTEPDNIYSNQDSPIIHNTNNPNDSPPVELLPQIQQTEIKYITNCVGDSNIEKACSSLVEKGMNLYLIIVSENSTGIRKEIYDDLKQRNFSATTGPDEGFNTRVLKCYPYCVFVLEERINSYDTNLWKLILEHEYRHSIQAINNPNIAKDFKENGRFTSYAAFSEACADYGLNTTIRYRAEERMGKLKKIVDDKELIKKACEGHKEAYSQLLESYNRLLGNNAFAELFPPFD